LILSSAENKDNLATTLKRQILSPILSPRGGRRRGLPPSFFFLLKRKRREKEERKKRERREKEDKGLLDCFFTDYNLY